MLDIYQYITTGRYSLIMEDSNCTGRTTKGEVSTPYNQALYGQDEASKAKRAIFDEMNIRASRVTRKLK